jgi:GT2 family glycosyltransferase/glycosyltransferase involved in cell wall biosynthesis
VRADMDSAVQSTDAPAVLGVSVAIACHNNAAFLARAIESALSQDPAPHEVVVCDDGSTDDTAAILAGFGSAVHVVRHTTNRGEAAAKNAAVRATTTPFVALLDADDEFLPGRLAAVAELLAASPDLDLVTTDAYLVHQGRILGRWYAPNYPFATHNQRAAILDRNFIFGQVVMRREAFLSVGGFDERVSYATDWDCWIRMIYAGARVGYVPEPLAIYRLHETSLSSNRLAMSRSAVALLTAATTRPNLTDEERALAGRSIAEHSRRAARDNLKQSLVTEPSGRARVNARAVLRDRAQPSRSRLLAAGAWLLPLLARAAENGRERATWTGPGDIRLPRALVERPQVLLTVPDRPWPADGGKRMRACATVQALSSMDVDLDVVVLFAGTPVDEPLPPGVVARHCLQVDAPPRRRSVAVIAALARALPWQIAVVRWGRAREALLALRKTHYDLVWFGATDHAVSLRRVVHARRTIVDMDDVETPKLQAFLSLPKDLPTTRGMVRLQRRIELPLWRRVGKKVTRQADALVVCSELDRSRLGNGYGVVIVPNGYPAPTERVSRPPKDDPPTLILIGTYYYPPNVDAAMYAATQVLPLLREQLPEARLRLVGRGGQKLLGSLAGLSGVDIIGGVLDVVPELAHGSVSIAPIRYGGGTRVKILEAFAHGLPVVSTSLACEGLEVVAGVHLLVADGAAEFAAACAHVLQDEEYADRLSAAAYALYSTRYRHQNAAGAIRSIAAAQLAAPIDRV